MLSRILSFVVLLLFVSSLAQAQQRAEFSVTRDYVSPVIMFVERGGNTARVGSASIVVVAPGFALTASHVMSDLPANVQLRVQRDGKLIPVQLIKKNDDDDIALIRGDFQCPCAPVATREPFIDQDVVAVGFPFYSLYGIQLLTRGNIQGVNPEGRLVTTTDMAPGASGGGVFVKQDGEYKLVGIITAIGASPIGPVALNLQQQHNWIAFSVPLPKMRDMLKLIPAR